MSALPLPIAALAAASHVAPALVAPFFRRMMLIPRRDARPAPHLALPAAERLELGGGLVAWRSGEGPTVLLVHGFEGNRAQFGAVIEALVARGFSAVALDIPAHGESTGNELTAPVFMGAIERALTELAPVHAVIGHSLGGAMALYTIAKRGGGVSRAALLSAPSALRRQLWMFADAVGLSKRGAQAFIASVEAHVGRPADEFDVRHIASEIDLPLLLVHDQNDRQVPVLEAARSAHMLDTAELIVTRGLGHNRLLADPKVVASVADFVAAQETPDQETIGSA
jgi:pimeloyl-ACP methyl ester carboxylesterase